MARKLHPTLQQGPLLTIALVSLFRMGCIVIAVDLAVCAVSSWVLRLWLKKENKKFEEREDGELHGFRYVL